MLQLISPSPVLPIQRNTTNARPCSSIHSQKVCRRTWQRVALFGLSLYNTFAYAHRPSALNKNLRQHTTSHKSDNLASTSQGYNQTIQSNIERIEDWDMERMHYDEAYMRARIFNPQAMEAIGKIWLRQIELSDKMVKERNARADVEMKENRERWKIASEKEAARIALIEAEGFSQVFNVLGVVITCWYNQDAARNELTQKVTPNAGDNVAHLGFASGCKVENQTPNYFRFGVLQKVLAGTYVQAMDTIKAEEIFKVKLKADMIDVKPGCKPDKSGKRACEEDGLLFYGHKYEDGTGEHYTDNTQILMPGATYAVYFSDVPDYRCITTFDKKKLLDEQAKGMDHFKGKRSHYTGLGLAGGGSVELDIPKSGDQCYPEGSSIKTIVGYEFANIMALRDISDPANLGPWEFPKEEMTWIGRNTCSYDGSTSSYDSPETIVKETDLREITNTRDTYDSLKALEVGHDYLSEASQLVREQTGQDAHCQPTKPKDELLQLRQQPINYKFAG